MRAATTITFYIYLWNCGNIYNRQRHNIDNPMKQDLQDIIARVQDAIFLRPEVALGFGVWSLYKDMMQTSQRPDGSVTRRRDKTTLSYMENGVLYVTYNGGSHESGDIWKYLRKHYGNLDTVDLLRLVCDDYGIPFDNPTRTMKTYSRKPSARPAAPKTKPIPTVGDESDVCTIPEELFTRSIDLRREDSLRAYLETWIDAVVLESCWHLYGVGIAKDGAPLFWYFDRHGRCRDGKVMRYRNDGHRDKDAPGSILAVGAMMKKAGILPESWRRSSCLYGEHLLNRWPDAAVGLVESEKTALVCAVCFTRYIWLATGGKDQNIDRAKAILNGRRVIAFPDADAAQEWTEHFQGLPGWSISTTAKDFAAINGPEWAKCDLCDILEQQAVHTEKHA